MPPRQRTLNHQARAKWLAGEGSVRQPAAARGNSQPFGWWWHRPDRRTCWLSFRSAFFTVPRMPLTVRTAGQQGARGMQPRRKEHLPARCQQQAGGERALLGSSCRRWSCCFSQSRAGGPLPPAPSNLAASSWPLNMPLMKAVWRCTCAQIDMLALKTTNLVLFSCSTAERHSPGRREQMPAVTPIYDGFKNARLTSKRTIESAVLP